MRDLSGNFNITFDTNSCQDFSLGSLWWNFSGPETLPSIRGVTGYWNSWSLYSARQIKFDPIERNPDILLRYLSSSALWTQHGMGSQQGFRGIVQITWTAYPTKELPESTNAINGYFGFLHAIARRTRHDLWGNAGFYKKYSEYQ